MVKTELVGKSVLKIVLVQFMQVVREQLKTSSGIANLELVCMDAEGFADKIIENSVPKIAYITIITEEADHE